MPTTAQDRAARGPFAALLILLSLVLGSATAAAAGPDLRGPSTRLGSSRQGPATALLHAGTRNPLDEEASGSAAGPSVPPSTPSLVTLRLCTRPRAEFQSGSPGAVPRPASACYRARAPPAL